MSRAAHFKPPQSSASQPPAPPRGEQSAPKLSSPNGGSTGEAGDGGQRWRLDRTVSLAVIAAVMIQAGGALLWAGRAGARIDDLSARIERQGPVAERLARLEEQAAFARSALSRIEAKLDRASFEMRLSGAPQDDADTWNAKQGVMLRSVAQPRVSKHAERQSHAR